MIRACYITNAPGAFHDSTMANMSGIYDLVDDLYQRRGTRIGVHFAFGWLLQIAEKVYKSYHDIIDRNGNVRQNSEVHKQATSVWQLSEWGMCGLQGSFLLLKDWLIFLELVVLLYTTIAQQLWLGIDQIQLVFMPHLERRNANKFIQLF